jgi:hypothetical protein
MYIPVGCIPLSEAIEAVAFDIDAAAMKPTMPEALSRAEQALQAAGPWSVRLDNPEGLAIINWYASAEARKRWTRDRARQQLQQALGNGVLSAFALLPDGAIDSTPNQLWRTSEGTTALTVGYVMTGGSLAVDPSLGQPDGCPIFVQDDEFRRWRAAPQDPAVGIPERQQEARQSAELPLDRGRSSRKRSSGGRPKRADWKLIDQETDRVIAAGRGKLTRTELRKHIKAFAAANISDPPDDRTIERHLDDRVPDDVLAEH